MPRPAPNLSLTSLIESWREGQDSARKQLFEAAYLQLKEIATKHLRFEHGLLSPTELLHEAALCVLDRVPEWHDRAHFFASMSLYMRGVLIDHARMRASERRGQGALHVSLSHAELGAESPIADLLALDQALQLLEQRDTRCAAVLHLSIFAGLGRTEIAGLLDVSVQIVDRELRFARTWLSAQLGTQL